MKSRLFWTLAAAAALTAPAMAAPTLYDNFNSGLELDRSKWTEPEAWRALDEVNGRLIMGRYLFGGVASDTGLTLDSWNSSLIIAAPVLGLRANVTVTELNQDERCAANASVGQSGARLIGSHFNVRAGGPVAGDRTGDVLAQVRLRRTSNSLDAPGVLQAQGVVIQCTNADCSTSTVLPNGAVTLTTVPVGTPIRLQYSWDKANKKFVFGAGAFTAEVPYTDTDTAAPSLLFANLSLRNEIQNCTAGKVKGGIAAAFDNVIVSQ